MRIRLAVLAIGGALAGSALAGELNVKLTVREPAGVARKSAPARGGIPLPWNTFKKDQEFTVSSGGAAVPAQVLPMVVDKQGYLRWVVVDAQVDLSAKGQAQLVLTAGKSAAKPASPVKLDLGAEGATVDTGKIKFAISKGKPFTLFTTVEAGGKPVTAGGEVSYTDATLPDAGKWKKYVAGKPEVIEASYAGPMRVTLKVSGPFAGDEQTGMRYIARISAWAGRSDVHVKYSLANSNPDQYAYRRVSDSSIALKLAAKPAGTLLGASKPISAGPEAWMKQGLWSSYAGGGIAGEADKELWKSKGKADVALGWIAAKTGGGAVFACDRFFADNPARELAVERGALVLRGVILRFEGVKDSRGRVRGQPYRSKPRWLLDSNHLSSEYVIDFAAAADPAALAAAAKAARQRLHVMAEPSWYSETEGLEAGKFGTQEDEMKCYDLWKWKYDRGRAPKGPTSRAGGRFVAGIDNHYDSEGDVVEALTLMYIRTGSRAYFDAAQAWANHGMDLRIFRTDGWRYKDGGVWWTKGGPAGGNRPQRPGDPVTGFRHYLVPKWSKGFTNKKTGVSWDRANGQQIGYQADARQCNCHNYAAGMAAWFSITGDQDAREAAIDSAEMNYDFSHRVRKRMPGKVNYFSRDFTRQVRGASACRLIAPDDEVVVRMSDYAAQAFLQRPMPEPRGFVNHPGRAGDKPGRRGLDMKALAKHVGPKGLEAMKKAGVRLDAASKALVDSEGRKWRPIAAAWSFMFPMMYRGIDSYGRATGDEDANDWSIALAKAFAQVAFQEHCNFHSYSMGLVDFPVKGVCRDAPSWATVGTDNKFAEGIRMSGYAARHWPDGPVRGYSRCGEKLLLERGKDLWFGGSHRGYWATKMHHVGGVGMWVNWYRPEEDNVGWTLRLFYEYSHMRKDGEAPKAVTDLKVTVAREQATVSFTAPADVGGGKVARYQVKCSEEPIVDYEKFLGHWKNWTSDKVTNWWMATNVKDEPAPKAPGARESFTVTGVPAGAKFFAVRAYDDSSNRSGISNVSGE